MAKKYTADEVLNIIDSSELPWERQVFETEVSHRIFTNYYLKLPAPERNEINAYREYLKHSAKEFKNKYPPAAWRKWSESHHWQLRAEAYDIYLDQELQQYVKKDQFTDLVEFRKRQRALAGKIADAAVTMIEKALEGLKELNGETLSATNIANYIKTASQVAEMASNAEASSLALTDIIQRLSIEEEYNVQVVEDTLGSRLKETEEDILFEILDEID